MLCCFACYFVIGVFVHPVTRVYISKSVIKIVHPVVNFYHCCSNKIVLRLYVKTALRDLWKCELIKCVCVWGVGGLCWCRESSDFLSVLHELNVGIIHSLKCHMNMGLILNSYRAVDKNSR
jgi:hypothetical protein